MIKWHDPRLNAGEIAWVDTLVYCVHLFTAIFVTYAIVNETCKYTLRNHLNIGL